MQTTDTKNYKPTGLPPSGKERLLIWERAIGMWKDRKPDPIKELQKMRREGERKLS